MDLADILQDEVKGMAPDSQAAQEKARDAQAIMDKAVELVDSAEKACVTASEGLLYTKVLVYSTAADAALLGYTPEHFASAVRYGFIALAADEQRRRQEMHTYGETRIMRLMYLVSAKAQRPATAFYYVTEWKRITAALKGVDLATVEIPKKNQREVAAIESARRQLVDVQAPQTAAVGSVPDLLADLRTRCMSSNGVPAKEFAVSIAPMLTAIEAALHKQCYDAYQKEKLAQTTETVAKGRTDVETVQTVAQATAQAGRDLQAMRLAQETVYTLASQKIEPFLDAFVTTMAAQAATAVERAADPEKCVSSKTQVSLSLLRGLAKALPAVKVGPDGLPTLSIDVPGAVTAMLDVAINQAKASRTARTKHLLANLNEAEALAPAIQRNIVQAAHHVAAHFFPLLQQLDEPSRRVAGVTMARRIAHSMKRATAPVTEHQKEVFLVLALAKGEKDAGLSLEGGGGQGGWTVHDLVTRSALALVADADPPIVYYRATSPITDLKYRPYRLGTDAEATALGMIAAVRDATRSASEVIRAAVESAEAAQKKCSVM